MYKCIMHLYRAYNIALTWHMQKYKNELLHCLKFQIFAIRHRRCCRCRRRALFSFSLSLSVNEFC